MSRSRGASHHADRATRERARGYRAGVVEVRPVVVVQEYVEESVRVNVVPDVGLNRARKVPVDRDVAANPGALVERIFIEANVLSTRVVRGAIALAVASRIDAAE